jgi:hypothetical protein
MSSGSRGKKEKGPSKGANRRPLTLLAVAATVAVLACLFLTGGSVILRFFVAIVVLVLSGRAIASLNGIKDSYGLYLIGGKGGIDFVDRLASGNRALWVALADWGFAFSFGILSFFMFRKYMGRKAFVFGIASVVLIMVFVFPYLSVVLSFISIPQLSGAAASGAAASSPQGFDLAYYALIAITVVGGFSLFTIALILYSGAGILLGIFQVAWQYLQQALGYTASSPNYGILSSQIPGVAPVIPGITIPFFAGVISLVILLAVHEFSHGIQARMAKIRISSIGVVLFGIIPIGAFVEPDESKVAKLKARDQDRISIAGVAANMATALLFFAAVLIMIYAVLPNVSTGGVAVTYVVANTPAYGVVATNSTILAWNGQTIRNDYDLMKAEAGYAGGAVTVTTDKGSYVLTPEKGGKIGIEVAPAETPPAYQIADFIYAVAALSFGLNFFVAIFNLLPIPGLDGWRIYQGKVRNKRLLTALAILVVAGIAANALPWFWTL